MLYLLKFILLYTLTCVFEPRFLLLLSLYLYLRSSVKGAVNWYFIFRRQAGSIALNRAVATIGGMETNESSFVPIKLY